MWARPVLLLVLVLIGPAPAQSPPVVPYPRDYKTSLVKYAVVDRSDGMSRDLYASRDAVEALKRDPRLQEFPVGVLLALDVYWALASAYLGKAADAQAGLKALLADEKESGLEALYGMHGFLCEVLRLRGDLPGALAHGRRAVELAEERGSPFSRVEAAAFLDAAELAAGDVATATGALERALGLACTRRTALWYEPRILATLAEARRAAGDRSGASALLAEARESVERGRGCRLSACDAELARVRLLASEPVPDRAAVESALVSVETLAADLGADPYRRMAELERARLARTVSVTPPHAGSSRP